MPQHKQQYWLKDTFEPDEIHLSILVIIVLLAATLLHIINWQTTDYVGVNYLVKSPECYLFPVLAALWYLAKRSQQHCPRLARFTWFYTSYLIIYTAVGLLANGVQYTPFNPIDPWLLQIDHWLGFSVSQALQWGHASTWGYYSLSLAYDSLIYQLIIIPTIVFFLSSRYDRPIYRYFKQLLICGLIGMMIYYFLPSVAPAHYVPSAYFSAEEHNTYWKFYELHHHIPILSPAGGMVAFPSFHVIWAVLLLRLCWPIKWLFAPLVIINTLLILATVLLGWHYLIDVIGGFALAGLGIFVANHYLDR